MEDSVLELALPKKHTKKSLERLLGKPHFAYDVESINAGINGVAWDLLSRGGKRWRPRLFELIFSALGGKRKHLKFAAFVEMIHNGTLMIDDIEDGSELRRGKPCIHLVYGTDVAINAGNTMYYLPLRMIMDSGLPPKTRLELYEMYSLEMIRISHGQGMDIWWHRHGIYPTESQYLQMCAYKTGDVARLGAKFAGILLGLPAGKREIISGFAESLGVAFQIQDDLLNLVGDVRKYGKEIGGDITEGKKTLAVIRAVKRLPADEARELKAILAEHTRDQAKIGRAIGLIGKSGAVGYSKGVAKRLVEGSWKRMARILPECDEKEELRALAEFLINREL